MSKFEVVGRRRIAGVAPGGVVTIEDEAQQRRLIKAGHIKPQSAKTPTEPKKEG